MAIEEVGYTTCHRWRAKKFKNKTCRLEQHDTVTVLSDVAQLVRACDLILFTTLFQTPHHGWHPVRAQPLVLHVSLRDLAPEILLNSQNVVDDVDHVMKANTSPHLAEQEDGKIEAS